MTRLAPIVLALLCAGSAGAQVVTYDRSADFLDAVSPGVVIDFEEIESGGDQRYSGGYERDGVLLFASDGYMYVRNYEGESNGFLYAADGSRDAYLEIELPAGTTAVGANVTTFYTLAAGLVRVTLSSGEQYLVPVNRWAGLELGPASSYFGVISAEPLEWVRFEALENDDPRDFEFDVVVLDNVAVSFEPPQTCPADLALCEAELATCLGTPAYPDADGDGEADATDACPDTEAGAEVDAAGCSRAQFCAAVPVGGRWGAAECQLSDWRNDEVFGPRDCMVEGGAARRAVRCVAR